MTPVKDVITQTYGEEAWYALLKGQMLEYMATLLRRFDEAHKQGTKPSIELLARIKAAQVAIEELKQELGRKYFTLKPFEEYQKLEAEGSNHLP